MPGATFTTPLTMLAQNCRMDGRLIGLSISDSGDVRSHGLCELHEQTLADEVCLYFLLAGCQIAYGGALTPQIQVASNFTIRLFELVRGYSDLAKAATGGRLHPIVNYAPWPLRTVYDDTVLGLFGDVATLSEECRPLEIVEGDDEIFPRDENGKRNLEADTPLKRLAWARGLTAMRAKMTGDIFARVAIGGRVDRFVGLYPGIFEEAWMGLMARKPVFLCGAFGGASNALINAIVSGKPDSILACLTSDELVQCLKQAEARGMQMISLGDRLDGLPGPQTIVLAEKLASDFCAVRHTGIAASLNNGLTDDENHQLFRSCDPAEIVDLIFQGLRQLPPPLSSAS